MIHTCSTSGSVSRADRKARYLPSGLKRGELSLSLVKVSLWVCAPSQLAIQMSDVLSSSAVSTVRTE